MAQFGKGYAKRSTPSYFMAIVGVSLVLFLLGLLGWIVINANRLGDNFRESLEVQVYVRQNISPKDSAALVQFVAAQPYVKSYDYITKEMARKHFVSDGNDDFMAVLDQNPLPASVDFRIKSEYANADSLNKIKEAFSQNIAVDGGQIVLNVGGKAGLKVGDQLNVERVTREIKDPATGQVIRRMTSPVGIIRLTDVDPVSAVGTIVSGSDFKVGDAAKTITQ